MEWPIHAIDSLAPSGEQAVDGHHPDRLDRRFRLRFGEKPPVDFDPDKSFRLRLHVRNAAAANGTFDLRVIEGEIGIADQPVAGNGVTVVDTYLPLHKLKHSSLEIRLTAAGAARPERLSLVAASISPISAVTEGRRTFIELGRAAAARTLPSYASAERFSDAEPIAARVRDAILRKDPFSLVRLGDGEGRLLGYPTLLHEHETLRDTIHYVFGPGAMKVLVGRHGDLALSRAVAELASFVRSAVEAADIVAVPSIHCYREVTEAEVTAMMGMASASLYASLAVKDDIILTETFIFQEIQRRDLFRFMLEPADTLSVVAHSDFSADIATALGVADVRTILVPGHYTFTNASRSHYPEAYEAVVETLVPRRPGDVFLVAAGYLGKHYCNIIKQRGGIAIDIGSVFDAWFGIGRAEAVASRALRLVQEQ